MRSGLSFRAAMVLMLALLLGACASTGSAPSADNSGNPDDPWEGFNRGTFAFNEALDSWVVKPVAKGYDAITPTVVREGVGNFFGNIEDVWIGVNNLFQGKPLNAVSDFGRVLVNSTMGIAGLIDVATPMGLQKHNEDFGQTLGVWGVGNGPYVVLPILGPRTLRDTGGFVFDYFADPVNQVDPSDVRYGMEALRIIDMRAGFLPAEKVLDSAALDKYSYLRSAYLQRRRSLIFDGNPPREEIPED